jgi:UDP-N-acetyl-2-amino-2-deoxyglucuronate dehydrogenase
MPATMRVGIVGCGNIAANHVIAFRGAGVEIAGCADVDAGRAAAFARRHEIPAAVGSVGALLDLCVDVVSVCTPHPTHEAVVTAAAARGVHVVCESPSRSISRRPAG